MSKKLAFKHRKTARLATKALKNKPEWKPSKGYKYLKDIPVGKMFLTQSKLKGVLINCDVNAKVIIIDAPSINPEDRNFYLGKKIIAAHTEVKEI